MTRRFLPWRLAYSASTSLVMLRASSVCESEIFPWSSKVTPSRYFAGMNCARPSARTITPNSLPSFSRAIITSTIMPTIASRFMILRVLDALVLGSVTVSVVSRSPTKSSTLKTRLASPAIDAP